ncbi:MAG TPA: MarR family winged helix-turn-helix transcriptional regulator, partial [Steroidobacteraceae bacterium]|nr:MarR family winged helix-turn-helix transcriptional regulator [Steroidobacteraceae bacterium]
RFANEQVSFMQWMVMANLARFEHLTATALAAETCHDMGALTRIVDGLEQQGLARRERSARDRRVVEITLTPEGRRHLQAGKRLMAELLNSVVAPFSRQELETLIALMQRMMVCLQEAEGMAAAPRQAAPRPRRARINAVKKRQGHQTTLAGYRLKT